MLDAYIFRTIEEVRRKTGEWNAYYNYDRPHESLGNMTPMEYSKRSTANNVRRNNVNLREKLKLKPKSIIFAV